MAEYSGLPQIEIPLYTIDFDGMKIPIILTYHAGGIKYQQYDGDVGVGWSIQASGGYRVNRDAYGKPDENSKLFNADDYDSLRADASLGESYQIAFDGYLALTALYESQLEKLLRNGYTDTAINPKKYSRQDSEYDRFTYMLPSTSGHFVIQDRVKDDVYIMEQHADKVKLYVKDKGSLGKNDQIIGLEITDESGFIHSLGSETDEWAMEITKPIYGVGGIPCNLSWLLKEIKSPLGNKLEYTYEKYYKYLGTMNSEAASIESASNTILEVPDGHNSYSRGRNPEVRLRSELVALPTKISSNFVSVELTRNSSNGMIDQIKISNKNNDLIRIIEFKYSKLTQSDWHIQLLSLSIQDLDNPDETIQEYGFKYYPHNLQTRNYSSPDVWGYYNNFSTYKNDPVVWTDKIFLKEFITNRVTGKSSFSTRIEDSYASTVLSYRAVDMGLDHRAQERVQVPNMFSLKEITYPTGGTVEYKYENNQWESYAGGIYSGNGLRIKRITTTSDDKTYDTDYTYSLGKSNSNIFISKDLFSRITYNFYAISYIQFEQKVMTFYERPYINTFSDSKIYYKEVKVTNKDGTGGNTISKYSIPQIDYTYDMYRYISEPLGSTRYFGRYYMSSMNMGYDKPELISKIYYDASSNPIQEEMYSYKDKTKKEPASFKNLSAEQISFFDGITAKKFSPTYKSIYEIVNSCFDHGIYTISPRPGRLLVKKEIKTDNLSYVETFQYNDKNKLEKTEKTNSNNMVALEEIKYPYDFLSKPYTDMVSKNILTPEIERITKKKGSKDNSFIETSKHMTSYGEKHKLFLPEKEKISFNRDPYEDVLSYNEYDTKGNLLQYTGKDGVPVSYIWSYNYQYPIAEIKNMTYAEVKSLVQSHFGITVEILAQQTAPDKDRIMSLPSKASAGAYISTYTYKPLVGILSSTNPLGITTYYEYDSFGRLSKTIAGERDPLGIENKKVIQFYDYNYNNK